MFCSNCGNKLQLNEEFCDTCGAKRLTTVDSTKSHIKRWHWLAPIIVLSIVSIALAGYFYSEHAKTKAAIETFSIGERSALEGEYKEAQKLFRKALEMRTHFPAAAHNSKLMESAIEISERLHIAKDHQVNHEYNKAFEQIKKADATVSGYSGKVAASIESDIDQMNATVKVAQIRYEMEGKSNLEELEPLLAKAENIDSKEADGICNEIRTRITEIAFAQANDLLVDHQYSAALDSVKKGLNHEPENEKLINLKSTIQNKQAAFEKAEQQRIEQALVAAAKEKEHNLNNALELNSIEATFNDLGDLVVKGTVTSKATVPITSISVSYALVDKEQNVYDENEVYIYPDILYPNETGTFEYTHYLIEKDLNVKYKDANWAINK